jgi:transcriptional antiterminator RfaH
MQTDHCFSPRDAWAVVNTQPHRERLALEHLLRQSFQAYCPLLRKRVSHARRAQTTLRPLFPSYLFVWVGSDASSWRPILSTVGVKSLVRCGDRPSFISESFIESLRAREVDGAVVAPEQSFQLGEKIRITDGAFDGMVATIVEMNEKDRVVVLMELLNRRVKVRVGMDRVAAIGSSPGHVLS